MGNQLAQDLWIGTLAFTAGWIVSGLQWLWWCVRTGVTLDNDEGEDG